MFLNTWDVRQEILVVSTLVNLNGRSVHMKNWNTKIRSELDIKIWSVHWYGLTELNKTIGRICCRKNSKR